MNTLFRIAIAALLLAMFASSARAEGEWEVTPDSERALQRGLQWLAANQGPEGNWGSKDLGLVSVGVLAFLADGHFPGRGKYGDTVRRGLDYVVKNARPSGLLNISNQQRDMYNHGLAAFVLGQALGVYQSDEPLTETLERALEVIVQTQCDDGGWDYRAVRQPRGHDLSLVVMQAKALRSAVDSGLYIPPDVVAMAIANVRSHYSANRSQRDATPDEIRQGPGKFTYSKGGGGATMAMAAAGVVCLQEFGQYDDWRIAKSMEFVSSQVRHLPKHRKRDGVMPFDAYTLYYVGQAIYQVGGQDWRTCYPLLRDQLVASQVVDGGDPEKHGMWYDRGVRLLGAGGGGRVGGRPGKMFGTAVACFVLAMPNRYLPILQEGKIESLRSRYPAR